MTTTTHFTALLADDRQARYVAEAADFRVTRKERHQLRRSRRPQSVLVPANTLQTRPAC